MKPTQRLHDDLGQSLWLDNITRQMLDNGTLKRYVDECSITGLTSNPTIFDHAMRKGDAYDEDMGRLMSSGMTTEDAFFEMAIDDLRRAADLFAPVHQRTATVDGWVSLEVSPLLAYDAKTTVEVAKKLHKQAQRPNVFIKIPGTPEGRFAIEEAIFAGVTVNITLLFDRNHYLGAADAYMRGLERRIEAGLSPDVRSVASLFISRWDKATMDKGPAELRNQLGPAITRQAYKAYRDLLESERWQRLEGLGARPQRLLFASTGTKDPKASDVMYIEQFAAPNTINTMPEETLLAFADHGKAGSVVPRDGGDCEQTLMAFTRAGIDVTQLAADLQRDGAKAFVDSWKDLLDSIESKSKALK
ncbi:MAG TPA: transaldolase [Terriglobales bacterium]|nr:transaldolase [Terriglobales bacterium]